MNSEHPPHRRFRLPIPDWIGPGLWLSAACLLLGLGGDGAREFLRYERQAILSGEVWRLITAHLVHLGWPHLWLNLVAVVILGNLFADVISRRLWWVGLLVSALAIDVGLLFIDRSVVWYVGLSGALHGMMLLGGLRLIRLQPVVGVGLVVGVIAKLAWEQWQGPLPFTESATGPVLVNAHLFGAIGGSLVFLWIRMQRQPGPAAPPL